MLLDEAGFTAIHEEFDEEIFVAGTNLKVRLSARIARLIAPFLKGSKGGNGRHRGRKLNNGNPSHKHRPQAKRTREHLLPIVIIWGLMALLGFWFVWLEDGFGEAFKEYYLLPWAVLAGVVVLAPTAYCSSSENLIRSILSYLRAWSYVFPAFVLGGVIVAFKWVDPYFLVFIDDPQYNLPLSLVYISLGFLGLTVGYYLPIGRYFADKFEPRLPKWEWKPERVWTAGVALLIGGLGINIIGFLQGIMGFQRTVEVGTYDAVLYFLLVLLIRRQHASLACNFQHKGKDGSILRGVGNPAGISAATHGLAWQPFEFADFYVSDRDGVPLFRAEIALANIFRLWRIIDPCGNYWRDLRYIIP